MNFEFSIPLCRDDLLTRTEVEDYVVDEVYSMRMLPSQLQEFKVGLRTKGALVVLEGFDSIFSVLKNYHQVESQMKEDAWDLIVKSMINHPNVLVEVLDGNLDPSVCQVHRNALKMNCYLLCHLMDLMEDEISRANAASAVGGKGRKKVRPAGDWTLDWDCEKERGIRALLQVMRLNVHRLWNPPIVEEEFTSLVTNCCYKLLENPGINRKHTLRDPIFQILGTMVKKHNLGLAFTLKTVQLLQHFEHLAATMALAVQVIATTFGAKTVVVEVMREIGRMDSKDLTKDTSGTRAFAAFLVDLAEKIPDLMLPSISVLLGLLDGESYNMRNSVVAILGEIVIRVLSKEGLDNNQKTTRDHFLDKLEDHIHDVNAFVRSKTLQIWINVVTEKALPLPRLYSLLNLSIGRLEDKSSQVRKYAIQLVSALLRSNPFAAKLPLEELRDNYEKESAKLAEMMPPEVKEEPVEVAAETEDEERWKKIAKDVQEAISAVLGNTDSDENNDNLISSDDTVDSVMTRIVTFLKATENKEAVQLYLMAKDMFPGDPPFSFHHTTIKKPKAEGSDPTDGATEEEEDNSEESESLDSKLILEGLRKLFVGEPMEVNIEATVETITQTPAGQVPEGLVNEVTKQQVLVQYLKDSMEFVTLLQKAIPILCQLLESKNNTDVMEGIDFFVTSYEFGLNNAMMGIRRMLGLVWSKEQSIKEAIIEAYKRLYLRAERENPRAWAATVAKNLTALTIGASVGDLTSLEELVSQFVKTGDLSRSVVQVLWERFSLKIPQTTIPESRGALVLLGMAAVADQDIVKSNIDVLVKEGLGPRAEEDFLLARDTCSVLLKMSHLNKPRENKLEEPFKFPQDHEIFIRIRHLLVTGLAKVDRNNWIPMAEEAANVIYLLGEHPDLVCKDILLELVAIIREEASKDTGSEEAESEEEPSPLSTASDKQFCDMLTRFLFLGGHIALRQLVHLDVSVFSELRRRHTIQEAKKESAQNESIAPSAVKKGKKTKAKDNEPDELTMEEEMGLSGALAEDAETEYIRKITEEHLVTGTTNLLALLQPIMLMVCNNPARFPDPKLQSAASLAMAKYMTVSSEFCDQHLQLLFTILEKSPNPVIRANAIIALGNITFRFPNLIEPWTAHLYARLRDESTQVRKNTLMMLTHLILNDMVKVKGQISELATCIVDYDKCISNLAKLFFFELAKKGNAIYNIMPDIISRLSDPEVGVDEESFRVIMRYLFSFIQKDRQCENLVEKLCHRFRATRVERQWRDLAFCLSMLSYNEKSLRKLQENEACFMDKLSDEDVYSSFMTIIGAARKFAKPETKTILDEFEQRINQSHDKGMEDDEAFAKAQAATSRSRKPKTPGRRQATRGNVKSRAAAAKSKSVEDSDEEEFTQIKPSKKSGQRRPKVSFSSDEEELELFEIQMREEQGKMKKSARPPALESDEVESDQENADPNVTYSSPNPITKKRHKSVCRGKTGSKTPTRSSRRGVKGAA